MEGREKEEEDVEGDEVMMEKVYLWWKKVDHLPSSGLVNALSNEVRRKV